jgi:hypothetical protein
MRAVVLHGERDIRVDDVPDAGVPGKAINSVARRGDVKSLEPQHSPKSLDLL